MKTCIAFFGKSAITRVVRVRQHFICFVRKRNLLFAALAFECSLFKVKRNAKNLGKYNSRRSD